MIRLWKNPNVYLITYLCVVTVYNLDNVFSKLNSTLNL